jgi:tellurite methyltransferase
MNDETRLLWDQRYQGAITEQHPARVLSDNLHLLPPTGRALDFACGLGANALLLARQGLDTWAWDISAVAISRLDAMARAAGLVIHSEVRDVMACPPEPGSFAVILVSRFLERSLAPALQAALRPGGLLFYQTFSRERVNETGPRNPAFLLEDNELLRLFAALRVRVYREEGHTGDLHRGFRDEVMFVGQQQT